VTNYLGSVNNPSNGKAYPVHHKVANGKKRQGAVVLPSPENSTCDNHTE